MADQHPVMNRSVMQLLFTYLPERTVDWENGQAIVMVGSPRIERIWTDSEARMVREEVSSYLHRWRAIGGRTDDYPDPVQHSAKFAVGTPLSADAAVLITALRCYECSHLVFRPRSYLANTNIGKSRTKCPGCTKRTLRQFGLVFVHGCGNIIALTDRVPIVGSDGEPKFRYIRCDTCQKNDALKLDARSDRASGYSIVCKRCRTAVLERLTASCHRCARRFVTEFGPITPANASLLRKHTLMRITRHSASEAYYVHSLTRLRLGRVSVISAPDDEMRLLQRLLPPELRAEVRADPMDSIETLLERARAAQAAGDGVAHARLMASIAEAALRPMRPEGSPSSQTEPALLGSAASDIPHGIAESLALLDTVTMRDAFSVAAAGGGASAANVDEARVLLARLGLSRLRLVDDLPIVSASFGYSRRSSDSWYEELGERLPTFLRPFPALDARATLAAERLGIAGRLPILAREGDHEGLFFSLEEARVVAWLELNGIALPQSDVARARLLAGLEEIDRYYDDIWQTDKPIRRMLFGLLHTLSHAAMRAASFFSGLDRTSISEYLFLPLLGSVVYANSSTFKMGGMEALAQHNLSSFLEQLASEAVSCIYDPDCLDRASACHGCVHSPEIACRVFNHGLGRAFLLGGRPPWATSPNEAIIGYWDERVTDALVGGAARA